jgi:hypothetical protein
MITRIGRDRVVEELDQIKHFCKRLREMKDPTVGILVIIDMIESIADVLDLLTEASTKEN